MSGIATVILVIHTLVALAMIGVILLQRSEGGALGGLGGGSGSFLSARSAGNVLTRTTTILVVTFFLTSMALTILGKHAGPRTLQFGTPANGKVVTPQPVPAPSPAAPSSNAPASPLSDIPGFGAPKPAAPAAPSSGEVQPPVSLEKPAAPPAAEPGPQSAPLKSP